MNWPQKAQTARTYHHIIATHFLRMDRKVLSLEPSLAKGFSSTAGVAADDVVEAILQLEILDHSLQLCTEPGKISLVDACQRRERDK